MSEDSVKVGRRGLFHRSLLANLLFCGCVALASLYVWKVWSGGRQPYYHGRSLSHWVKMYANGDQSAGTAIREIGTNGIPALVRMLHAKDSAPRIALYRFLQWLHAPEFDLNSAIQQQLLACAAFEALGASGKSAIPELTPLACDTNIFCAGCVALAAMGPEGVATLSELLTNGSPVVRCAVVAGLGKVRNDASLAATALATAAGDPNQGVRWMAACSLGNMATEPAVAVPALINLAKDPSRAVRASALEALGQLGKAAKPGMEIICRATNDPDSLIRAAAVSSLGKIQQSGEGDKMSLKMKTPLIPVIP